MFLNDDELMALAGVFIAGARRIRRNRVGAKLTRL